MEKYQSPLFVIIACEGKSIWVLSLKVQLANKTFL